MRRAVKIAQEALEATIPLIRIGMTEKELSAELVVQLLKNGSDSELPFAPIVSGGPNAASDSRQPTELAQSWRSRQDRDVRRASMLGRVLASVRRDD